MTARFDAAKTGRPTRGISTARTRKARLRRRAVKRTGLFAAQPGPERGTRHGRRLECFAGEKDLSELGAVARLLGSDLHRAELLRGVDSSGHRDGGRS
jgi:hypothetical protein